MRTSNDDDDDDDEKVLSTTATPLHASSQGVSMYSEGGWGGACKEAICVYDV